MIALVHAQIRLEEIKRSIDHTRKRRDRAHEN